MQVREVMSAHVITVDPDDSFHEVVGKLLDNDISGVPVVDGAGRLLGIVTEADLMSNEAYGYRRRRALALVGDYLAGRNPAWVAKSSARLARDLMSGVTSTARPEDDLRAVARRMLEHGHKRMPVVQDGRLVGIVSRHDLLAPFHRPDPAVLRDVEAALADVTRVPETHQANPTVTEGVVSLEGSVQWPQDSALVEAMVARVPGVVAVDNRLVAREPSPHLSRTTGVR
ncbi:MAG TPA: CBS domain-containing protein [Acidimicrobiales bacterium]|nr:CBS domain-containing protein [Acidimicrobiales bacterium]